MSQNYGVNGECIYSVDRGLVNKILLDECVKSGVEVMFETSLDRVTDFETGELLVVKGIYRYNLLQMNN